MLIYKHTYIYMYDDWGYIHKPRYIHTSTHT